MRLVTNQSDLPLELDADGRVYPRKAQKLQNVSTIEAQITKELDRQFHGLNEDQKSVLLSVFDKGTALRARISDPNEVAQITSTSGLDIVEECLDYNFVIETYNPVGDSKSSNEPDLSSSKVQRSLKPTQKYSKMINPSLPAELGASNQTEHEVKATAQMRKVAADLQLWATDTLEAAYKIDPEVLEQVRKLEEADINYEKSEDSYKEALLALERVDVNGFNVLLNASKPYILDSNPTVKLQLMTEASISGKDSGVTFLDEGAKKSGACIKPWYMSGTQWDKLQKSIIRAEEENKAKSAKRLNGALQQHLEEIKMKREIEFEQIMKGSDKVDEQETKIRRRPQK